MMNLKKLFKKDYTVGLDIGTSFVKMALFAEKEDGPHLVRADIKELTSSVDDEAREMELLAAIKAVTKNIDLKKAKVVLNINCPETVIKRVIAPYMPKHELQQGVKLEAKGYFAYPIDESMIDFEIMGDIVEKGVRKYELIVAACPINTVDKYLVILKRAGIKPASFVSSSYALEKIGERVQSIGGNTGAGCYIDMGKTHTELIIFKGKYLMFSRKIPVAGSHFTSAMTSVLASDKGKIQLTLDEAEKIKREAGIPGESDTKIFENKITSSQVLSLMREPLELLTGEIERCFDYYREEYGSEKIDNVVLYGGGASLGGLNKFLSDRLGMEVRLGDPLEGLKVDSDAVKDRNNISHRLEIAIGAALSYANGINLLPAEIKDEMKRVVTRGTIEGIVTAVILISVFMYVSMNIQLGNFNKKTNSAKMEFSSLGPSLRKAEAQLLANKVLIDEAQWEDVFMELSNLIPGNVHLEELKMDNSVITIKGVVSGENGEQALANFVLTLENGLFNNVKMVSSNDLEGKVGVEFEIRCWIDYENS